MPLQERLLPGGETNSTGLTFLGPNGLAVSNFYAAHSLYLPAHLRSKQVDVRDSLLTPSPPTDFCWEPGLLPNYQMGRLWSSTYQMSVVHVP